MSGVHNFLLIMRHAKSDQTLSDVTDFDRPLNDRGENQPNIIAKAINKLQLIIEKAVVSSAKRTVDTWQLLEKKLHHHPEVLFEKKLYHAYYQDVIQVLLEHTEGCRVLLVIGHNPSVTEVCEYLTGEYHEFKPASLAILRSNESNLYDSLRKPRCFHFQQMLLAK